MEWNATTDDVEIPCCPKLSFETQGHNSRNSRGCEGEHIESPTNICSPLRAPKDLKMMTTSSEIAEETNTSSSGKTIREANIKEIAKWNKSTKFFQK